ncbi:DUF3325 domain-containing protein [Ferrovibrio terrae]|uniref:DUF3325 domain-containing protein n=1 Tax=Ferrovibrio terrae TaxID=2594003 RepID=UPI0031378481
MMMLLATFCALAGFAALCFAMPRHHRQLWETAPGRRRQIMLRFGGSLMLALSFLLCGSIWDWKIGPVAWLGLLTATGLLLVFMLPSLGRAEIFLRRSVKNRRSHSS